MMVIFIEAESKRVATCSRWRRKQFITHYVLFSACDNLPLHAGLTFRVKSGQSRSQWPTLTAAERLATQPRNDVVDIVHMLGNR
jgi:hypothetical protein